MEFDSAQVRECHHWLQTVGFGEARGALERLLARGASGAERVEAECLRWRIEVERDDPREQEAIHAAALALLPAAKELPSPAAVYHVGIVCLLNEDSDGAEDCFRHCLETARNAEESGHARYGLAAVLNQRKQTREALQVLIGVESPDASPDFQCLVQLLKGNCFRALGDPEEALRAYGIAQRILPHTKSVTLKNWLYFHLGVAHARRGDGHTARTMFEIVLSMTHPVDFRRLHRLASDELARLETKVEVFFDPDTGDVLSSRGYLSLRRKPVLIAILKRLVEASPRPVTKESLYQGIWGAEYHPLRHDGLIYSHMQRLRQILFADIQLKDFIVTLPEGYGLNPEVRVKLKETHHES